MIRRWLERFRLWLLGDVASQLALVDTRLAAIERQLRLPVQSMQQIRDWECGHRHVSGVIHHDRPSECVDCNQKTYVVETS